MEGKVRILTFQKKKKIYIICSCELAPKYVYVFCRETGHVSLGSRKIKWSRASAFCVFLV